MSEVLTKCRLSFMYKMIQEIISVPRVDWGYLHNFMVNPWVFKDDASETDAKTNSRHRVCPLLVGSPFVTWRVQAQSPLSAHYTHAHPSTHPTTHTHTHTHLDITSTPREYPNFFTQFTGNSGPSIFKSSTHSNPQMPLSIRLRM